MNSSISINGTGNGSVISEEEIELFISPEVYNNFVHVAYILTPIICIAGLIGNGMGIGVLWSDTKQQHLTICLYLLALTLFDALYLLLGLLRSIPHIIEMYNEEIANYIGEHMKLGTIYADMVLAHTSTAIIIVMSFERLLALVFPFSVKHTKIAKFPKTIICICFLANVAFLLPFPLFFKVGSYNSENSTEYYISFNESDQQKMDAYMMCQTVVDYFIPVVLLVASNTAIPIMYARTVSRRQHSLNLSAQNINSKQTKITMAIFCITLLYILLALPNLVIKVMAFVDKEYSFDGKKKLVFWFVIDVSNLFTYINAANDFVIYVLVSDYYRKLFVLKYCKRCHKPDVDIGATLDMYKSCSSVSDKF